MVDRFAEARRRAGYASNDGLARALKETAPEAFNGIEPRSLGAKLGELGRGVSTWWRGRPDRLAALHELTGFDAKELVAALVQRDRGWWMFPEFLSLPPLDLMEELPAQIGAPKPHDPKPMEGDLDDWLHLALPPSRRFHRRHPPEGIKWLTIAAGWGRGLLLARFQTFGEVDVVVAETLDDAVSLASGRLPLVLAPKCMVRQGDLEALIRLSPDRPVLIVADGDFPTSLQSIDEVWHPRWDWLTSKDGERRRLALMKGSPGGLYAAGQIGTFVWRPVDGWRTLLLDWLEKRLAGSGDSLFTREGLDVWLQRFDPTSVWFSTPSDLLSLAWLCHESGERKLPSPQTQDAGGRLLQHFGRTDSRAESILRRLVQMRWRDASHDFFTPLTWSGWQALVDLDAGPFVESRASKTRKVKSAALDLEVLRCDGFLTADSQGLWAFAQPTQARLILRDTLIRWVSEGDIERWARPQIGDASRQAAVSSVLSSLPMAALKRSLLAVSDSAPGCLAALSAAESLFVSLGSKFSLGQVNYTHEIGGLVSLIFRQYDSLIFRQYDEVSSYEWPPFTRAESDCGGASLSWLLACWEWSLNAPPPPAFPASLSGFFPGWLPRGDDAGGDWYSQLPPDLLKTFGGMESVPPGFDEAARSAQRLVDRLGCSELMAVTERGPLWAALMLVAAGRGKAVAEAAWWDALFHLQQAQRHLIDCLEQEDVDAVVTRLLPSLLEAAHGKGLSVIAVFGPIWIFMFEKTSASKVLRGLPDVTVEILYRHYRGLPLAWQLALDDRLGPDSPRWCWESALAHTTKPDVLADRLLSSRVPYVIPAGLLWRCAPDSCLACVSDPGHPWSPFLIDHCPDELSCSLAEVLVRRTDLLPDRELRLAWALRQLSRARGKEAALRVLLDQLDLH